MRTLIIVLYGCLLSAPVAYGWNSTGHRMTAEIAFGRLTAGQQSRIGAILRAHPRYREDFAAAMPAATRRGTPGEQALWLLGRVSYWPDLAPNFSEPDREKYHRGTWHYINLPVYLTADDQAALEGTLEHNMSLVFDPPLRQGLNVVQALAGNLRVWQDPAASDADKAVALCWIVHLTGDLHQPLHTVALFSRDYFPAGDRGGNSIRIEQRPEPGNLHSVWDNLPNAFADLRPSPATTRMLANETVIAASPADWVLVHRKLALEYVYTPTLKSDLLGKLAKDPEAAIALSDNYRRAAATVAKEQVVAAGYRLASLLQL